MPASIAPDPVRRRRRLRRGSAAAVVLAAVGLFSWSWFEALDLRVERVSIPVRALPPAMDGLTVLLLADLHVSPWGYPEAALLRDVDALAPDLVVIAGDFPSMHGTDAKAIRGVERLLPKLHARLGVWAVRGNHDGRALCDALAARGVRFLDNEAASVETGRGTLWLAGVDDAVHGYDDVARAVEGVPSGAPYLLLSHSPSVLWQAVAAHAPVLLAAHTHGGQICIPFFGAVTTGTDLPRKYASGLHEVQETRLYVTRGVGTTFLPLRFCCPPEISLVTLRAEGR